jgi:hypothetical protein
MELGQEKSDVYPLPIGHVAWFQEKTASLTRVHRPAQDQWIRASECLPIATSISKKANPKFRVAPGLPQGAPTDPDEQDSRIRFLGDQAFPPDRCLWHDMDSLRDTDGQHKTPAIGRFCSRWIVFTIRGRGSGKC